MLLLLWMILTSFVIYALSKINFYTLRFIDGVLIGGVYFIIVPMIPIIIMDEHHTIFDVRPFVPSEDTMTMVVLFVGMTLISVLSLVLKRQPQKAAPKPPSDKQVVHRYWKPHLKTAAMMFFLLDILFLLFTLVLSGRLAGGHWAEVQTTSLTTYIIVAGLANFMRTSAYGILLYLSLNQIITRFKATSFGLILSIIDTMTTFNRISIVYLLILTLILYRRYFLILISGILVAFPFISYVSSVWTVFRGLALVDGYSISGMMAAFRLAQTVDLRSSIDNTLFSIFESPNIIVLNYIVENTGGSFPILYGWTYIGRSLLFFVPNSLWDEKPPVFGLILGSAIEHNSVALNSTLFGEVFANFYWFWPFALAITLIFLNWVYNIAKRLFPFAGHMGAFIGIAIWRFDAGFLGVSTFALFLILGSISVVLKLLHGRRKFPNAARNTKRM